MSDIKYRRFEPKDRDAVLALFLAAFGKPRDPAQWDWEFMGGPRPAIIVVAEADGKIVGHYAILPKNIKVGDSVVESGLVVDVMTHPQYGKKGIFVNSGLESFRQAKTVGLEMLIGFPNEAAIRGHQKVGWTELGCVSVCARPLKGKALKDFLGERIELPGIVVRLLDVVLRALNSVSIGDSASDESVSWISPMDLEAMKEELGDFIQKASSAYQVRNSRDVDWITWRLSDPLDYADIALLRDPLSKAVVGIGVLKVKERDGLRTGVIMDLMVSDDDEGSAKRLLQEIFRKASSEDCEIMVMFRSPAASFGRLLRRMFILKTPKRLRFIVRSVSDEALPEKVLKLENWHLELIDHDVL